MKIAFQCEEEEKEEEVPENSHENLLFHQRVIHVGWDFPILWDRKIVCKCQLE